MTNNYRYNNQSINNTQYQYSQRQQAQQRAYQVFTKENNLLWTDKQNLYEATKAFYVLLGVVIVFAIGTYIYTNAIRLLIAQVLLDGTYVLYGASILLLIYMAVKYRTYSKDSQAIANVRMQRRYMARSRR